MYYLNNIHNIEHMHSLFSHFSVLIPLSWSLLLTGILLLLLIEYFLFVCLRKENEAQWDEFDWPISVESWTWFQEFKGINFKYWDFFKLVQNS